MKIPTIEKPIFKTVMADETVTRYLSTDDKEWSSEEAAVKWNQRLEDKEVLRNWPQHESYEGVWYAVTSRDDFLRLRELVRDIAFVSGDDCLELATEYPILVRWAYGGDCPETLVIMVKKELLALLNLL